MTDQPQTIADVLSPIELLIFQAQERTTQRDLAAREAERNRRLAECEKSLQEFAAQARFIFSHEVMELFDFVIDADADAPEPYATISYAHCLNRLRVQYRDQQPRYLLDRIAPDHSEVIAIDVDNPQHYALADRADVQQENADRMLVELARVHNLLTLNAQIDYTYQ